MDKGLFNNKRTSQDKLSKLMVRMSSIAQKNKSGAINHQQRQVIHKRAVSHFSGEEKYSVINQILKFMQKLQLEIQKYKQITVKIENKILTKGGLTRLKKYVSENYNLIIRQCYHLISMCENRFKLPKKQDFRKLRQYEIEMDEHWDNLIQQKSKLINQNFNSLNTLNTTLARDISLNQTQPLHKKAISQINKQFLAIRLVAYKLYEQYNGHSHQNLHKELEILREQENKLEKQINYMKQMRVNLQSQQAKIWKQLKEIKKINELIGRRHFISDGRVETNFSTNS